MFFLDSTKTPGNRLTDSRMIFKGYPLPHPALTPEPQKSVRNATEFLLRNSAKKYYQRGSLKTLCLTRERQDKKQDLGDKSHLGMGTQGYFSHAEGPFLFAKVSLSPKTIKPPAICPSPTSTPHFLKSPGLLVSHREHRNRKSSSRGPFDFIGQNFFSICPDKNQIARFLNEYGGTAFSF